MSESAMSSVGPLRPRPFVHGVFRKACDNCTRYGAVRCGALYLHMIGGRVVRFGGNILDMLHSKLQINVCNFIP